LHRILLDGWTPTPIPTEVVWPKWLSWRDTLPNRQCGRQGLECPSRVRLGSRAT